MKFVIFTIVVQMELNGLKPVFLLSISSNGVYLSTSL